MTAFYNWLYDYISPIFGYIMLGIYKVVGGFGGYGFALIIFTILARCLMFPTSLSQQKGMAKQQRLAPKIRRIQEKYAGNNQKIQEETQALYQREGYNPMSAGCLPLLIQMPLIIGLFGVLYNPLRYAIGIGAGEIDTIKEIFVNVASQNKDLADLATKANERYYPMYIIQHFNEIKGALIASGKVSQGTIDAIGSFVAERKFELFGLQLGVKPEFAVRNRYWAIPIFAGITSLAQSIITQAQQKKANPAMAKNPAGGCMTIMMPAMSVWFTFMFPAGIGVYWGVSNIFSALQSYLVKEIMSPQSEIAKLMVKETIERRSREKSIIRTANYNDNK